MGRAGRWTMAGLAAMAAFAVTTWLSGAFLITQLRLSPDARWSVAFLIGAAVAAFIGLWGQSWATQNGGQVPAEQLAPHEQREREARDQLRHYLGRRDRLPRMDQTSALRLGVHRAIDLPQSPDSAAAPDTETASPLDQELPTFVGRVKGKAITSWMRRAREDGGFLVLVGDSSVGKTRLLHKMARDALPDFAVLAPEPGKGDLVNLIAGATFPLPKLIVWLDELQRFLDGPYLTRDSTPITATAVRQLLDAPTPVVVLGAMWPEHAAALRDYPGTADILRNGQVRQETLEKFSAEEREAAAKLSSHDPRLAAAIADPDYTVTEVLAGAPQLIARYKQATEEQRAVLNAAIDARRLGIQAPLTDTLLSAAARGYLSTLHPDDTWLSPTLTELARRDRATAPLIPELSEDKRETVGHTVADFLLQRASRERRYERVPASTWDALVSHVRDPADIIRLADSAKSRLLYCYAVRLYSHAVDVGDVDGYAASRLARLLAEQGDLDGLRVLANVGNKAAAQWLDEMRAVSGDHDEAEQMQMLRALADAAYDEEAASSLAERLARILAERDDLDGLRFLADAAYDEEAAKQLARILAERDDLDGLRARADAHDWHAAEQLARILAERDDLDGLRARVDAGDRKAAWQLARLLAERDDLDELRTRADNGDGDAARRLAEKLADRGDLDELRARADNGDGDAASNLAKLLAQRHDLDGLRALADNHHPSHAGAAAALTAAPLLAGILADRGDLDELRARADNHDLYAAQRLAEKLADRDDLDELRARADNGDGDAARRLAEELADRGGLDELRARADNGDKEATQWLLLLLAVSGNHDGAEQILRGEADEDVPGAASSLAKLLAQREDLVGLRALVDAGDWQAARQLPGLLSKLGRGEDAERLRRFGLNPDGSIGSA